VPTPELLCPAGTLKNLRYALAYGADAVYAGAPRYSLRVRENDFDAANLATGIAEAHDAGRCFYLVANALPHGAKLLTFLADLAPLVALQPDALIMADPGLIALVREHWPELPIHLSVQANTANAAAARFWRSVGIRRVILSRELSLDEIAEIREECPDVELEVFVHGALCIAYSGRCLLSGYFNHRDANQGACTNACRWEYRVGTGPAEDAGTQHYLEETTRPGQFMPVFEDGQGTYLMNAKDLRAVEHVARLVAIGVDSLKIEGRTKSAYYVARTAQVYRRAIDRAVAGEPFDPGWLAELEGLSHRGYTDGFLQRHEPQELQNYRTGASRSDRALFVAEVVDVDPATGQAELTVKNKLAVGDEVELIAPGGNRRLRIAALEDMDGRPLQEAPGGGWRVRTPLALAAGEAGFALLARLL
jgi:U32 family peptidase